jgi:hypothetical protein
MSGRRGIEDDQVEARGQRQAAFCPGTQSGSRRSARSRRQEIDDSQDAEKLVDAWRGEIDELADTTPTANRGYTSFRAERGDNFIAAFRASRRAPRAAAASSAHAKILRRSWNGCGTIADRRAEHVGKGMRRIGRHQQHRRVDSSRASRTAVAAAVVVLPTPPFPPNSSIRAPWNASIDSGAPLPHRRTLALAAQDPGSE